MLLVAAEFRRSIYRGSFYSTPDTVINVGPISRHAVGTSGKCEQYVVKLIGPCRKIPCLGVAAKTAVDDMFAPPIHWAYSGKQRVSRALLEIEGKTKVMV